MRLSVTYFLLLSKIVYLSKTTSRVLMTFPIDGTQTLKILDDQYLTRYLIQAFGSSLCNRFLCLFVSSVIAKALQP
jgi:hypothetical protein